MRKISKRSFYCSATNKEVYVRRLSLVTGDGTARTLTEFCEHQLRCALNGQLETCCPIVDALN